MNKKCKVVMLPTNQKATYQGQLVMGAGNHLFNSIKADYIGSLSAYNLYILSDDEIKEGDWCYKADVKGYDVVKNHKVIESINTNGLLQWKNTTNPWYKDVKKIIATTDSSLRILKSHAIHEVGDIIKVPLIPQSFIEKYISEYNKGNKIEEVMVEYFSEDEDWSEENGAVLLPEKLKLNPDNTINIQSIKDSWTKDEVTTLILQFGTELIQWARDYIKDKDIEDFNINKWIESNL